MNKATSQVILLTLTQRKRYVKDPLQGELRGIVYLFPLILIYSLH